MKKIASVLLLAAVAIPAFAEEAVTVTTNNAAPVAATPAVSATEAAPVIATPAAEPAAEAKAVVSEPVSEAAAPASSVAAPTPVISPEITPAQAAVNESVSPAPSVVAANKGFYATADFGVVSYSAITSAFATNYSLPNPNTYRIGGGYYFTPHWAVEAVYSDIGDAILTSISAPLFTETVKAYALEADAVATYPLTGKLDVFGKLGLAYTKLAYSFIGSNTSPLGGSGSGSKVNLMFGLGAKYSFNQHYAVRVQYVDLGKTQVPESFDNGSSATSNIGVRLISLGGMYSF